jgi:hypothetical protein
MVIGCASIDALECQDAARRLVGELPAGRGLPFDIQISLGSCPNEPPCPRTLAARGGIAFVEYAGGADSLTYSLGGVPPILGPLDFSFSDPVEPDSARAIGPGPFPFELGHCGLNHVVDFDGSFWVALGQIDGEASGFINSESGQMRLLGPNVVQYQGVGGFIAQLVRFPGAKRLWGCD